MEIQIASPVKGVCQKTLVKVGDIVGPLDDLVVVSQTSPA
jgi:biotin carboxyl carrier protein